MEAGVLTELARMLAETTDPRRAAAAVAGLLQHAIGGDVTVWCRDRALGALTGFSGGGDAAPDVVADYSLLPLDTARVVFPVRRFGRTLGAMELPDTGTDHSRLLGAVANQLAIHFGAAEVAEAWAQEVAQRSREVEDAWRFASLIIDTLPVGLYVVDRDYRIRIWNRSRELGTQGIRREDAVGRVVFDVLSRQPAAELRRVLDHIFDGGEPSVSEVEVETPEGGRVYRQSRLPMHLDGDLVSHVVTVGEDITAWRRVQASIRQTEKLASLGQLAAGVMHEINNPLATMSGAVDAATYRLEQPVPDTAGALEFVRLIEREVGRCSRIVNGLLDFSRVGARRRDRADLNDIVETTLDLAQHHKRFRRVVVARDLAPTPVLVRVNAEQVVQALLAIVINALDAMEPGGRLGLATGPGARPNEVRVDVSDTGSGIAEAVHGRLFDPFFTTKEQGKGTGLGLSIAWGLIDAHSGRIEVESDAGQGSLFRIILPAEESGT
jgi:two-component system NtrC family sensor kinase